MIKRSVRVSIGIPVYNGENYIEAALDSFLAQTFEDFEIIISDNASTDRTQAICQSYALKDSRIRYHRNTVNLGAAPNHNLLVRMAKGEYFKWAAHDDICAPTFLEKCVEVLDRDPGVVNCYSWTQVINERGHLKGESYEFDGNLRLDSDRPNERFHDIVCTFQMCYPIFGLMRKSVLEQTPLQGSFSHADGVILARLALLGRYYEIPEPLFFSRQHAQQSWQVFRKDQQQDNYSYTVWFDSSKAGKIVLPYWILFSEYSQAILDSPISFSEKVACVSHMVKWLNCYWKHMVRELPVAGNQLLQTVARPVNQQPVA